MEHLVAHTRWGNRTLVQPGRAEFVWQALRRELPEVLAASLLPNHIHGGHEPGAELRFRRVLRRIERRFTDVRFDVLPPAPARSPAIAARTIRYILRNPVQDRLVDDPYAWPWSTIRDLVGATANPWVDPSRLARVLDRPPERLLEYFLQFDGRRVPSPLPPAPALATVEQCLAAVASAFRTRPDVASTTPAMRRVVIHLADEMGRWSARSLGHALGCSSRTVYRDRTSPPPPGLSAARTCLADPRLLRWRAA